MVSQALSQSEDPGIHFFLFFYPLPWGSSLPDSDRVSRPAGSSKVRRQDIHVYKAFAVWLLSLMLVFRGQLHTHLPPSITERKLGITELGPNTVWELEDLIRGVGGLTWERLEHFRWR